MSGDDSGDDDDDDDESASVAALEAQIAALRAKLDRRKQAASGSVGARGIHVGGSIQQSLLLTGTVEGNVYVGPPTADPEEALRIYLGVLVQTNCDLPLRALDARTADATQAADQIDIRAVYIDLDTTASVAVNKDGKAPKKGAKKARIPPPPSRQGSLGDDAEETRPLRALEAATLARVVLLGDPGSGKSTFVNHLALCLATFALSPGSGKNPRFADWPEDARTLVPIQVVLRDFAASIPARPPAADPAHLWGFLRERLAAQNLAFAADPLHDALEHGRALVLLDGLDEVPSRGALDPEGTDRAAWVRAAVTAFEKRYPTCRVLVTCRTRSYERPEHRLPNFESFQLAPFDPPKIQAFLDAWYAEIARRCALPADKAREEAESLKTAVGRPDLADLASNPLLLTVMALVHTHRGRLPEKRALLYEETIDLLLWRWDDGRLRRIRTLLERAGRSEIDLKRVLWRLAFDAHEAASQKEGAGLADISEWQLEKALAELHPQRSRDWAHEMALAMKLRAGLLIERVPEVYTFPHRTFQEYLAGVHLTVDGDFAKRAKALFARGPYWEQVILLGVGHLVHRHGDTARPLALVGELCPRRATDPLLDTQATCFAGEVLDAIERSRVEDSALGRDLADHVRERLLGQMRNDKVPVELRARAGDALGRIGDPRFRAEAWYLPNDPLLGFVRVPEGPFLMGSDPKVDKDAYDDEQPQHTVTLPEFYIGRYPVTVAQFRAFVEDSGHEPADRRCLRGVDNHPVVHVEAEEADAYAAWLTKKLAAWEGTPEAIAILLRSEKQTGKGGRVTLPSEAEWEKAARGTDGRIYPWGQSPDANRANYHETKLRRTTAVGCFPTGAGVWGCEEASGNVWEWTCAAAPNGQLSKYPWNESVQQPMSDNVGHCVVRGGAFLSYAGFARCAIRGSYLEADSSVGFRVAVSPFF